MTTGALIRFDFTPPRVAAPRGRILQRALRHDSTVEYFYYVPTSARDNPPVVAAVHGASRKAHDYVKVMAPMCEAYGAVLVAPLFGEHHRDFQRLGREGKGQRADITLHRCLTEVGSLTGADVSQFRLFGFSGGAQFAHRYTLAHPHRVAHLVAVAAGWYTFPDVAQRFPYGTRPIRGLRGVTFNPEDYLSVPVDVLVGQNDVGTNNLRDSARVNSQQGENRVERARRWVAAMKQTASEFGMTSRVNLIEVPGVGHAFADFCKHGDLIKRTFELLFSTQAGTDRPEGVARPNRRSASG